MPTRSSSHSYWETKKLQPHQMPASPVVRQEEGKTRSGNALAAKGCGIALCPVSSWRGLKETTRNFANIGPHPPNPVDMITPITLLIVNIRISLPRITHENEVLVVELNHIELAGMMTAIVSTCQATKPMILSISLPSFSGWPGSYLANVVSGSFCTVLCRFLCVVWSSTPKSLICWASSI